MGKRCNFTSIQLSHYVPTVDNNLCRVRTGYERVIAHQTRLPFAYAATQDGTIEDINDILKLMKVRYKDGSLTVVKYGETYSNNGGGGFYITQKVVVNNFNPGDKFKQGDVLVYNSDFFTADLYSKQVDFYTGVTANVAFLECDGTIEDSNVCTLDLAKKLNFSPVQVKDIGLTKDTVIHQYAAIGTHVKSIDTLITFDQSAMPEGLRERSDDNLMLLLDQLNRATPKAKYTGTVCKIEVFHKCKTDEMSESLRDLVHELNKVKNLQSKYSEEAHNSNLFPKSSPITGTDRIANTILEDDTVIIRFFIQQDTEMNTGDKIVFDSSLKSVCAKVVADKIETEDNSIKIDAMSSARGVGNRLIFSPLLVGVSSLIMERVEKNILDMYFDNN